MSFISRIEIFFRQDLWVHDLGTLRRWRYVSTRMLRLTVVAFLDFRERALGIRATSLVSTTLFSFVPFLAVTFSILKAFGVHQQIEPMLTQGLEPLGEKSAELSAQIIEFVNNLQVSTLGAVGVAGLLYTTFSLIDKIEEAFNHIWHVRQSRPLARKFTDYLSVVLVGPVLILTAVATTASAQNHWLIQSILTIEPFGTAVVWAATLMPFLLICGSFSFLYKFIPHTQVQISSACVGGVTAGILWQIAGLVFAYFVAGSVRYSAVYSSFAILVIGLLWVYIGWLIVLVGAQVAYYYQHPSAYLTSLRWKRQTSAFREQLVLMMLVHMTRRYLAQDPPYQEQELAVKLGVPLSVLEEIVEDFIEHWLVYRTVDQGLMLGRPPDQVSVLEILQLVYYKEYPPVEHAPNTEDPVGTCLQQRDQAIHDAFNGLTLHMLAAKEPSAPSSSSTILPFVD